MLFGVRAGGDQLSAVRDIQMNTVSNGGGASDGILVREDRHGVATLTLNRPHQLNALSESMLDGLQKELDAIAGDANIRCVVRSPGQVNRSVRGMTCRRCAPKRVSRTTRRCLIVAAT